LTKTSKISLSEARKIRQQLSHPVVDADGHWLEMQPVFVEYIADVGGPAIVDRYKAALANSPGYNSARMSHEERVRQRVRRQAFWGFPNKIEDRGAVMFPGVFRDMLEEWGFDVALLYPTVGFLLLYLMKDPDLRSIIVGAYNTMVADMFGPYGDRLIPAAAISLHSPSEAIEQLEHAHGLGLKLIVANGTTLRPIEADADFQPDPAKRRFYVDAYGLDSPYNYDPVWQKFIDLKLACTVHTGTMGWPDRSLPSSFVTNHLGHFAQSHHVTARSLFMGGVTQRFPNLKFGFLEGGTGWACNLLSDLIGHWKKRNKGHMHKHMKPTQLDRPALKELARKYMTGNERVMRNLDEVLARNLDPSEVGVSPEEFVSREIDTDEFEHVTIRNTTDIMRLFTSNFYFGCEADDPMTTLAYHPSAGLKVKAMLGSDIAHFDVIDAAEVLPEAWEMVEHGLMTEADFREYTFTNVVELHASMNPDFFRGTTVEGAVKDELAFAGKRNFLRHHQC